MPAAETLAPEMSPVALTVPPVAILPPVIVPTELMVPPTNKALDVLVNVKPETALVIPLSLNSICVLAPGALILPEILPIKLAAVTLPVADTLPPVAMLPPVIVLVAETVPPVATLPTVAVPVALTVPPVAMLPPVIVPVAEAVPAVARFPPVMVPVTLRSLMMLPDRLVVPETVRLPLTKVLAECRLA